VKTKSSPMKDLAILRTITQRTICVLLVSLLLAVQAGSAFSQTTTSSTSHENPGGAVKNYDCVSPPGWDIVPTPTSFIIIIESNAEVTINGARINTCDFVGCFYRDDVGNLKCGGACAYTQNGANAFVAFGDDPFTPEKEGFVAGDTMFFKIFSWSCAGGRAIVVDTMAFDPLNRQTTYIWNPNNQTAITYMACWTDFDCQIAAPVAAKKNGNHTNKKSRNTGTSFSSDFDDLNNQSNHFYYYYSNDAGANDVEPLDYTASTVTKVPKTTSTWTYENGCPSNLTTGGGGGTEGLRSSLSEAQSNIVNTETVLLALVDGGDTETLNADVETSTPPETAEIYNELMTGSPYLSETVVGTAIDKEEVLPNSMVRDVMVANPHTSTSLQLLEKLDDRTNPMPAWMKAQILAGRSIQSLKTELEGELAGYQMAKYKAMNSLARHFGQQPENTAITDSLIALYQSDNTVSSRYMQAWLYLNSGQYQQGQNVMASIPANFTLAGDELAEYQNLQWLYAMLKGLLESGNGLDDLSEAQIAQLHAIVADETDFASVYARNMLLAIDDLEYQEPIILPNSMKSAEVEEAYHKALNSQAPTMLEVYPNPSKDFIILAYQFDKETKGMIEIRDISGKPVQSIPFDGIQDQVTLTTHGWSTGVYVLSLVVNDKVIETTKFTLVK